MIAKAPKTGTGVEVWQIGIDNDGAGSGWAHIRASDTDGGIEASIGGNLVANAHAMVCGVQIKTKGDLIYAVGKFATGTGAAIACGETLTFCLDAAGAELADTSSCVAAGLNTFSLGALNSDTTGISVTNAKAFIETLIAGVEDFNIGTD